MPNDKIISISLPSIDKQRSSILKFDTERAISILNNNLQQQTFPKASGVDYSAIDQRIFNTLEQGWVAPPPELVDAWFNQVKVLFNEYGSDSKLGELLGLQGRSSDRRIRAYRKGDESIPYGVWRSFLELTGRAIVDVKPVLGRFDAD